MSLCRGCGGVVGRDCWNPQECEWISRDMEARAAAERVLYERDYADYCAAQEREYGEFLEIEYQAHVAESGGLMLGLA